MRIREGTKLRREEGEKKEEKNENDENEILTLTF